MSEPIIPSKKNAAAERSKRHRAKRLAAGLCICCTNPASQKSKAFCEEHRSAVLRRMKDSADKYADRRKDYAAGYYRDHSAEKLTYQSEYARNNKEQIAAYKRSIREVENARKREPQRRARRNEKRREKKLSDPASDMADRLRKRIGRAMWDHANGRKSRRTAELLGCSMPFFMAHIETQFLPGMRWENRALWHLDHKRPCASFDLTDPEQQLQCFHYTNLQPLWAHDNIQKHAKVA